MFKKSWDFWLVEKKSIFYRPIRLSDAKNKLSLIVVAVKSASCFKRKHEDDVPSTVDSFTISRWSCLCNWWGKSDPLRWTDDDNKFTTDSVKVPTKSFVIPRCGSTWNSIFQKKFDHFKKHDEGLTVVTTSTLEGKVNNNCPDHFRWKWVSEAKQ